MKKKIVGILVSTLFIATAVLPAVGTTNKTINKKNVQMQSQDAYDMVIIAPSIFSNILQKLINHKNKYGINTTLKTTESIYKEYTGVDKPEQIKYFIKDALETWHIKYVLLVGGMKSYFFGDPKDDVNQGSKSFYVPVRYTNVDDGEYERGGYISDLYYADIYDSYGNFSSWDSNGNGVFAEWKGIKKDKIDLYPDVYLGRLACRNTQEVKITVNKIITYESTPADPSWFKKMVVVGGENWDDVGTNYLEGEVQCDKALSYMPEFTPVKLYASNRDSGGLVPSPKDIVSTISKGCGFLYFAGFGSPREWNTHWPGDFNIYNWTGGIKCIDFLKLKNKEKLPICIAEGNCLNQFNVTILACLKNPVGMNIYQGSTPESWGEWLSRKIGGGAIATIADTGATWGYMGEDGDLDNDGVNDPDCVEAASGYMTTQFFKIYNESHAALGQVFGETIKQYLDTYPGMSAQVHAHTVETWTLLGDPSLMIGGYI